MMLTPLPMFTNRYGNNDSRVNASFDINAFSSSVYVNASSRIVSNKKFAPATAHAISSSFCSVIPNRS